MKTKLVLFGLSINIISYQQLIKTVNAALRKKSSILIFPINIHNLIQIRKMDSIAKLLKLPNCFSVADGVPLVIVSKLTKTRLPGRVSGTDLAESILCNREARIFIIASNDNIGRAIKQLYSSVCDYWVAPMYSGNIPFEKELMLKLKKIKPNVLIVTLGCPTQEKWIYTHLNELVDIKVILSAGSALELITGKIKRAPKIVRDNGFEWLWRIIFEPKRLAPRYIKDFIEIIYLWLCGLKKR